ncbi:MerR family transcriptional regulator [Vibrio sp. UCD-FRSSP16_10]|uniref:MerR family DNA-binding protein n=1 Tax=unclassified Vibrio TaxID=2614977 RepID=UPI0007FF4C25|nr:MULTISPECIES: MerR family DNA-binding protein [unclassified Vibrio]OBT13415.1 MerR family transcriptional regulator [Vibrio sp. UCD-FRSSP16_10]OBT17925.1 MerR family transcriptional regulator [Vibrio sp. UCD-FRSSP16_30]
MMTSKLAKSANVSADTVRYYTKRGLITATRNPDNGYKEYDFSALQRLTFIHQARELGFSLKEVEDILASAEDGQSPCPKVRQMMTDKITETEAQIQRLQHHVTMLKRTFNDWDDLPDSEPTGHSICCLIESWTQDSAK